ncbi:helix-turn-helix transcriptional regulator [Microbacterium sp.]|uniref:helix-turn-helix transcriptional regulator n=1 Tax=Microbacterium sp. TaxID=51671 RepID=UPI00345D6373
MTTVYLDSDFLIDQVFWQYAFMLPDRLSAQDFASTRYAEPTQLLRLGEEWAGHFAPRLDELVTLSIDGPRPERFYRMQSLLFAIFDVISPYIAVTDTRTSPTQRPTTRPVVPRHRTFAPVRTEARLAEELLRESLAHRWTIDELASCVHLSTSHLSRVFVEAFGKSPLAYLTMLRAQELARLLRLTELTVAEAGRRVGWTDPDYAGRQFRRSVGVTPRQYRSMAHMSART